VVSVRLDGARITRRMVNNFLRNTASTTGLQRKMPKSRLQAISSSKPVMDAPWKEKLL